MASSVNKTFSVFRISKSKYINDKKGTGSFAYGGRWNPKGFRVLYTSESRSLAFCELLSGLNSPIFPPTLSIIEIEIPKKIKIHSISPASLSHNWHKPFSVECAEIGKKWLMEAKFVILKVPSAVVKNEFNYVINTDHTDCEKLKFKKPEKFFSDERIIKKLDGVE